MPNFLASLLEGGVKGLAEGIGTLAKDIRTAITGETPLDATKQAELLLRHQELEYAAKQQAAQYDLEQMRGQIEINKIEAGSGTLFTSGWRPAVGWVCVLGLLYTFLLKPLLPWAVVRLKVATEYPAASKALQRPRPHPLLPPLTTATG